MDKIRIILADDQKLITQSLKVVLESQTDDMIVVGTACNGVDVVKRVEKERPDIILMDIRMPEINGVEATRIIHTKFPDIKTIMLTTFDDDELVSDAIDAGASGYLLKDICIEELIVSIRAVISNLILVSPLVASNLVHQKKSNVVNKTLPKWYHDLLERDRKLLTLIELGFSNKEISEKLFLAEQTVKNYLTIIYSTIGVQNRYEAKKLIRYIHMNQ